MHKGLNKFDFNLTFFVYGKVFLQTIGITFSLV